MTNERKKLPNELWLGTIGGAAPVKPHEPERKEGLTLIPDGSSRAAPTWWNNVRRIAAVQQRGRTSSFPVAKPGD